MIKSRAESYDSATLLIVQYHPQMAKEEVARGTWYQKYT
jgi:hypothetical protein